MTRVLKMAVSLVSTAAEAVGVKGTCSVVSVGRGTCWPTIHADVSGSSLYSLRTKTRSNLIRLVGELLSCRHTSCTCLILCRRAGRRHCAFAIVCPMAHSTASSPLGFRFKSFSRRRRSSDDRCVGRTGYLPLPFPLLLLFPFPFVLSERKVSLCTRLYQLCTCFRIEIVVPCISEKSNCVQFSCLGQSHVRY